MLAASLESSPTNRQSKMLVYCALLLIAALYVVGIVSHGIVRHLVQTAPVWPAVILGMRRSVWAKWAALPCLLVWFCLMALIWLFLLGWAHVISGTFSAAEIVMTLVVGFSCVAGMFIAIRMKTQARAISASAVFLAIFIVQLVAIRVSFLPAIAHDHWR